MADAYLYDLSQSEPALIRTFSNPDPQGFAGALLEVAFVGRNVLVGAPETGFPIMPNVGTVYLFEPTGELIVEIPNPQATGGGGISAPRWQRSEPISW